MISENGALSAAAHLCQRVPPPCSHKAVRLLYAPCANAPLPAWPELGRTQTLHAAPLPVRWFQERAPPSAARQNRPPGTPSLVKGESLIKTDPERPSSGGVGTALPKEPGGARLPPAPAGDPFAPLPPPESQLSACRVGAAVRLSPTLEVATYLQRERDGNGAILDRRDNATKKRKPLYSLWGDGDDTAAQSQARAAGAGGWDRGALLAVYAPAWPRLPTAAGDGGGRCVPGAGVDAEYHPSCAVGGGVHRAWIRPPPKKKVLLNLSLRPGRPSLPSPGQS